MSAESTSNEPIDLASTDPVEPAGAVQAAVDPPAVGEERTAAEASEREDERADPPANVGAEAEPPVADATRAAQPWPAPTWGAPVGLDDLLEQARARTAARQPRPWRPEDDDLDPTSDAGWEKATEHELIAVRPEDIPAVLSGDRASSAGAGAGEAGSANVWSPGATGSTASAAPGATAATPTGSSAATTATTPSSGWTTAASDWPTTSTVWGPPPGAPGTVPSATSANAQGTTAATAAPAIAPLGFAPAIVAPVGVPAAPADRRWRRGARRARRGLEAAARPFLMVALFAFGVSLGWYGWVRTLPPVAAASQPAGQAPDAQTTDAVPIQVQSLIAAIDKDDQQQIQVVVPADPYRIWAGEVARWNLANLGGAQPYRTYVNGTDSATELLIFGTTTDGSPIAFNLVVHIHDGVISDFR
ncbi:MAG TPA: hypothetical protein VFP22_11925 [Candidatus Limnocylindrales bacterium]|nr:hypothetical protein [Candidatus Limnocylindrales bacterium]